MNLYNMLFGERNEADVLLSVLGLTRDDFFRYRDCYLDDNRIAVYTRGGGGNRGCWCEPDSPGVRTVDLGGDVHEENCVEVFHYKNMQHPCYLYDEDDDFDNTYATFYFRIPEGADQEKIAAIQPEARNESWLFNLDALRKGLQCD